MIDGTHLDPAARSVWVDQYKLDTEVRFTLLTPDGPLVRILDVTADFVASMIDSFQRLTALGDRVTVLEEHKDAGQHYGTVHELRVDERDGEAWLQARVSLVDSLWEAFDDDRLVEWSPGLIRSFVDPHTGEEFENVLVETSFTSMALQRTLRPPQATNAHSLFERVQLSFKGEQMPEEKDEEEMEAAETPEEEEEESMEDTIAKLRAQLAAKDEMLQEMQAALDANREEVDDVSGEAEAATALAASHAQRIERLENELTQRELASAGIEQDHWGDLVELKRANASLYDSTVQKLAASNVDAHTRIGVVGTSALGGKMSASAILAEAEASGLSYTKGLAGWLRANHEAQAVEVLAIARAKFGKN